jgi:hypothetical protein
MAQSLLRTSQIARVRFARNFRVFHSQPRHIFLSYILLVLRGGPTFLILREIIYRYKMAKASDDVGDN